MELWPGLRLRSGTSTAEIVVVRATDVAGLTLECGGTPMQSIAMTPVAEDPSRSSEARLVVGKRYEHAAVGLEVLCTKAGSGPLSIGGEQLIEKGAKPLPSSD